MVGYVSNVPDKEWYAKVSCDRGVALRCPFATVEACPRFYQSLSLLEEAGATRISKADDECLLKRWKASDLWPRTAEQATAIAGEPGSPSIFSNFCPEVTFERFGYFATSLIRYADAIDTDAAHARLAKEGFPTGHPNWFWSSCSDQHFTDCTIYSVLANRVAYPVTEAPSKPEPWWRKYLAEIVVAIVVAIVGVFAKILG